MASQRLMLLLALLLLASSNHPSRVSSKRPAKKKTPKPKLPDPNEPLVSFRHFRVEIHNDLRMFLLDSHCYSKDNDLGLHVLFPDEIQDWGFDGNWLGTTNFHCKLEWESGVLEFDAFTNHPDFLANHCYNSVCIWSARQDGIYVNNRNDDQQSFYNYWDLLR